YEGYGYNPEHFATELRALLGDEAMNENITPPCDCIEQVDGAFVSRCYCSNSGDYADAVSWCSEQATAAKFAALTARVKELEEALRKYSPYVIGSGPSLDHDAL